MERNLSETMTTNTTNSQAASIDTPEFRELFHACESYLILHDDDDQYRADVTALVAHIDAKLAQAGDDWHDRANILEARLGEVMERRDELRDRVIAAESRLAEIQRGVEGLQRYGFDGTFGGDFGKHSLGCYVKADAVLALLQPQGQADTSGLPG